MSQPEGRVLSAEDLREAARLRFMEGLSWDRVAKRIKCNRKTLQRWRDRGEAWQNAVEEIVAEMRHQGGPTAWGALLRAAQRNDVAAAKEILNRIVGAVEQPISIWWGGIEDAQAKDNGDSDSDSSEAEDTGQDS